MPSIFKTNDFGVFLGGLIAGTAMWICLYNVSPFIAEECKAEQSAQTTQEIQVCKGVDNE